MATRFYKTALIAGQQVDSECLCNAEHNFGVFCDTMFKGIDGRYVYYVDDKTGKLQQERPWWHAKAIGPIVPKRSQGKVISMLMPPGHRAEIANMATMLHEAAWDDHTVRFVLGGDTAEAAVPDVESDPGVDLDCMSLPPTPPTPEPS